MERVEADEYKEKEENKNDDDSSLTNSSTSKKELNDQTSKELLNEDGKTRYKEIPATEVFAICTFFRDNIFRKVKLQNTTIIALTIEKITAHFQWTKEEGKKRLSNLSELIRRNFSHRRAYANLKIKQKFYSK
jgi:hypothetical protein